jgi:hypothetical protein
MFFFPKLERMWARCMFVSNTFSLKDGIQVDLKSECFTPESRYFTFINIR